MSTLCLHRVKQVNLNNKTMSKNLESSPEAKLLGTVKTMVEKDRMVQKEFGPFQVGDVVQVDKFAESLTVRSVDDPAKIFEGVAPSNYLAWTKVAVTK